MITSLHALRKAPDILLTFACLRQNEKHSDNKKIFGKE